MGFMAKAWIAFLGSVVTALTAALSDDIFDASDTQQVVLTTVAALITLIGVYATRNTPPSS